MTLGDKVGARNAGRDGEHCNFATGARRHSLTVTLKSKGVRMTTRSLFSLLVSLFVMSFVDTALAANSLAAQWTAPDSLTYEQVFNAALAAGTADNYTLVSNDRAAGIISFKQERSAGRKNYESRLNIQIKQDGGKVVVTTRTANVGGSLLHMAFSEKILEERIHNFHVYLFQELKITDAAQREISRIEQR
jgi:hypothetical protein